MKTTDTYGQPLSASGVTVAYTGTAGKVSLPVPSGVIRVMSTTDCFIEISGNGKLAVANTGVYLPAFSPEYFKCPDNPYVSAIQVSAGGSIYVSSFQ